MPETAQEYVTRILGYTQGQDPLEVIGRTPRRLRELIHGLPLDAFDFRPAPTKWSIREQLAHLVDAELVMTTRMRWAAAEPGSIVVAFDQDRWAVKARYDVTPVTLAMQTFEAVRAWTIAFLQGLTSDEGCVRHQERGEENLQRLIDIMAGHDLNHLRQIEELIADAKAS